MVGLQRISWIEAQQITKHQISWRAHEFPETSKELLREPHDQKEIRNIDTWDIHAALDSPLAPPYSHTCLFHECNIFPGWRTNMAWTRESLPGMQDRMVDSHFLSEWCDSFLREGLEQLHAFYGSVFHWNEVVFTTASTYSPLSQRAQTDRHHRVHPSHQPVLLDHSETVLNLQVHARIFRPDGSAGHGPLHSEALHAHWCILLRIASCLCLQWLLAVPSELKERAKSIRKLKAKLDWGGKQSFQVNKRLLLSIPLC